MAVLLPRAQADRDFTGPALIDNAFDYRTHPRDQFTGTRRRALRISLQQPANARPARSYPQLLDQGLLDALRPNIPSAAPLRLAQSAPTHIIPITPLSCSRA